MIPGRTLHRLAAHICSAKALEQIVEPAIADLQKEFAAADAGSSLGRAWLLFVGYLAILEVLLMCAFQPSVATDDERRALVRTFAWALVLTIAATGFLMLPPLSIVETDVASVFLLALVPQAVPLAIPIGLTFGTALGLAGRPATRSAMKSVLLVACAASVASFLTLAWVMPAGNQAYRESVARAAGYSQPLTKGFSEMTLSELNREASIAALAGNVHRANQYAWSFHLRFALGAASIVLVGLVVLIGSKHSVLRSIQALVLCFAYWALIFIGESLAVYREILPAAAGAWLPNLAFVTVAIVFASSRSSRLRGSWNTAT